MYEPAVRRRVKQIAQEMLDLLNADTIDAMSHGNLKGLANELDRLGDDLSDSRVKAAINSVILMVGGGFAGYGVGTLMDKLDYVVSLV